MRSRSDRQTDSDLGYDIIMERSNRLISIWNLDETLYKCRF